MQKSRGLFCFYLTQLKYSTSLCVCFLKQVGDIVILDVGVFTLVQEVLSETHLPQDTIQVISRNKHFIRRFVLLLGISLVITIFSILEDDLQRDNACFRYIVASQF